MWYVRTVSLEKRKNYVKIISNTSLWISGSPIMWKLIRNRGSKGLKLLIWPPHCPEMPTLRLRCNKLMEATVSSPKGFAATFCRGKRHWQLLCDQIKSRECFPATETRFSLQRTATLQTLQILESGKCNEKVKASIHNKLSYELTLLLSSFKINTGRRG